MKWFRVYCDILFNDKILEMDDGTFRLYINLLALATIKESDGIVPKSPSLVAKMTNTNAKKTRLKLDSLVIAGRLVEDSEENYRIKNWDKRQYQSDNSTARVKAYRAQNTPKPTQNETLHETFHETLHETLQSQIQSTETDTDTETEEVSHDKDYKIDEEKHDDDSPKLGNRNLQKYYLQINQKACGSFNDIKTETSLRKRGDFDEAKAKAAMDDCHGKALNANPDFRAGSLKYYEQAIIDKLSGKNGKKKNATTELLRQIAEEEKQC